MKYIRAITDDITLTFGPVLSATDAITPYGDLTGLNIGDFDFYILDGVGNKYDLGDFITSWASDPTITHLGNGYYTIAGTPAISIFSNVGERTMYLQNPDTILPYNLDLMVISQTAYDEMIYGAGGGYAELTYRSVSGANIPSVLESLSATTEDGFSNASSEATSNFNSLDSYLNSVIYANIVTNIALTEDVYNSVIKIGSISADIISAGGASPHVVGAIIKDIEVRDNTVYLSYRDTDGKMKVYSRPFVQDIIIASGGDLT